MKNRYAELTAPRQRIVDDLINHLASVPDWPVSRRQKDGYLTIEVIDPAGWVRVNGEMYEKKNSPYKMNRVRLVPGAAAPTNKKGAKKK